MYDSLYNSHNILLILAITKCSLIFLCSQYYHRYLELYSDSNFVIQNHIGGIGLLISWEILKAQKNAENLFWKFQDWGCFVIIILFLKLGRQKTAANYIKNDVKFATDIFRGTPCINHKIVTETVIVISSDPFWKCQHSLRCLIKYELVVNGFL